MDPSEAYKKELKRRRYSAQTIKTYIGCLERFLNYCKKDVKNITKKDIRIYLERMSDRNLSGNTMNVTLMSLKFYFEQILGRKMWIDLKYSKTPKRIQRFLTRDEVMKLINSVKNAKHKLMVEFMYGSGLRISEILNMKVDDLNLDKDYGFVRNGKGRKDRIILIPKKIKDDIIKLIDIEKLDGEDYLFQSSRNKRYCSKSLQNIIKKASKDAKLKRWKEIHPHTLRHSFATQLISNGYNLNEVQSILGHKSPETSMIYVHIASPQMISIKSPLDE